MPAFSHPYKLIRSGRKTLCLEIREDCSLLVRAPLRCPLHTIEGFLESRKEWIDSHLVIMQNRASSHPPVSDADRLALIHRAENELPPLVAHYGKMMNLSPSGISITGAQKRFGSCSGKNRLCFSWRLMQYPKEAIEYVVVHELAHIVHKNHGRDFYALIEKYMPDHKARRKLLKT